MAEQKHSGLLWLGLLGGGALLWWYLKKKNEGPGLVPAGQALPAAQPAGQAPNPSQQLPMANTPQIQVQPPQLQVMPTAAPAAPSTPNGIDPTVYMTVSNWVIEDGNKPPKVAMQQAAVPAEFAGMYDLITNVWDKGLQPDPEQVFFWDNLRAKYDPTHQYW